jgi:excisionase family DNA binding protein
MVEPKPTYTVAVKPPAEEPEGPPPLIRLEAAARRLGVSMTTIRRLIDRGELPAVRVGRVYRMDPRDLERFVEEHRVTLPANNEQYRVRRGIIPARDVEAGTHGAIEQM